MHLKSGTLLKRGEYRIIETLGRGGFGVTYLAEQLSLHRKVCIKEFFPKDYFKRDEDSVSISLLSDSFNENMSRFKAKFVKEAQTIADLEHSNIIAVKDVFEENNTVYYIMDYIEGESLSGMVKRAGAMSEDVAVGYIKQVASALGYIHERAINHLDVKPANIMVRSKDNRAILIDFGLSKHYDATSGDATSTTPVGVSHGFAPMEQYKQGGVSSFSPTTDIYALGATLYYLVTGSVPPSATDVGEEGLPALPKHLSSSLCRAIEKSMSYWRKDRPQSINDFLVLLDGTVAQASDVDVKPIMDTEATRITASDERTVFAPMRTYKVGDLYDENGKRGVVFEVSADGRHGKIVSLDETKAVWDSRIRLGLFSSTPAPVTGVNDMCDGKANTDKIMSRTDSHYFETFAWCRSKGTDWYMPAKDELKAICKNQSTIDATLAKYGDTLKNDWYWSSTESSDKSELCSWHLHMDVGNTYPDYKNFINYVRAVATF